MREEKGRYIRDLMGEDLAISITLRDITESRMSSWGVRTTRSL